jgi:hypothetical protein
MVIYQMSAISLFKRNACLLFARSKMLICLLFLRSEKMAVYSLRSDTTLQSKHIVRSAHVEVPGGQPWLRKARPSLMDRQEDQSN